MAQLYPMTPDGLASLQKELTKLKTIERPGVIRDIARARAFGDLSENAEYHAAKERQNMIENRIREIETKIDRAQLVDIQGLSGPKIFFGATVLLEDDEGERVTYQIVGIDEADIKKGKLSVTSPLARELIGKEEGMIFEFNLPKSEKTFKILSVSYQPSS